MRCGGSASASAARSSRSSDSAEVGAALGAGEGVDLVDDHVLHAAQVSRAGGQQQVQALGRGDEDVGRVPGDVAAVVGRRVAGPDADRDLGRRLAQALRREPDARERGAQVALDVVGQGLERADVQDAERRGPAAGLRGAGGASRRSSAQRNAARVLPLPVGAWMSVCLPAAMAAQPPCCASVGRSNVLWNHSRTGALKRSSGSSVEGGRGGRAGATIGPTSIGPERHFDQMF